MTYHWKLIPGYPGLWVSTDGCIAGARGELRTSFSDSGYLRVRVFVPGLSSAHRVRKSLLCHKAVLLAFVGPPPTPRHEAAHKNGQKRDNRLENLEWRVKERNEADKRAHGTAPAGFSGHVPVPADVERVRVLLAAGLSYRATAKQVGMHRSSVSRIARGLRHG